MAKSKYSNKSIEPGRGNPSINRSSENKPEESQGLPMWDQWLGWVFGLDRYIPNLKES